MQTVDVSWDFKLHIPIIPEEIKIRIRTGESIRLRITECSGFVKNAVKYGQAGINIERCRIPSLTGQRPSDIISENEVIWEQERCLCGLCANIAVMNLKRETPEIRDYFAINHVAPTLREKGNLHLKDENMAVIGCFIGPSQGELRLGQIVDTSSNISRFGKIILDQNQKVSLSIILTTMDSTTESKICNLCEQEITSDIINVNIKVMTNVKQNMPAVKGNQGRWPSNLLLDEESGAMLDAQSGVLSKGHAPRLSKSSPFGGTNDLPHEERHFDSGGASRFFYCAKASSSERNRGCESLPLKECDDWPQDIDPGASRKAAARQNNHPTVKPLKLMEYLITLIAPPKDAIILDPFMGSGTTLIACKNLGIECVGIEMSADYCEIAKARVSA